MSFIDDVNEEEERRWPVRKAVKNNAAHIQTARAQGKKLNTIYRTLTRKGQRVGKGYSSFRNAVRYLDEHGWPETGAARDRFADDRHQSDF